jgi:hypothetical protein
VCVFVIDCTGMGFPPPMGTPRTRMVFVIFLFIGE